MSDNENLEYNKPIHAHELNIHSKSSSPKNKGSSQFLHNTIDSTENHLRVTVKRGHQISPRDIDPEHEYNVDVPGSTYALQELQISLKNMKERYQKLQKKLAVIEDENTRLIGGKSDLFGEIGKMQESSIKLREKNLKLNHEVHSKHQDYCTAQEQLTAYSHENMKLTTKLMQMSNEKKKLTKHVEELDQENTDLREGLNQLLKSCKALPAGCNFELGRIEAVVMRSRIRRDSGKKVLSKSDLKLDLYEIEQLSESDEEDTMSTLLVDTTKDVETLSVEALDHSKRRMRKMVAMLTKQKETLLNLTPQLELAHKRRKESMDKLDERLDTNFNSRCATYNSSNNHATITLLEDGIILSSPINDSGGETNVLVEEKIVSGRQSPFDWRQVVMSDDDINEPPTLMGRPQTRTVSTSPDMTFDLNHGRPHSTLEEEERMCPMCNAVFPIVLPQETFESHVVSHFEIDNGFEVIT